MNLFPLKTGLISKGDNIIDFILDSMSQQNLHFQDNDILVLAESAVATSQGRIVNLGTIKPNKRAQKLGEKYNMDPRLTQIILNEADEILGGVDHVLLTLKDNVFQANAGVDKSNAPKGYVTLLPDNPVKTAQDYREHIYQKFNAKIGVIIADSRTQPLRLGNVGLALAVSGFKPVKDIRGQKDLFGKPLRITRSAVADNLASAAQILMGESNESIPAVLIRDAPVEFTDEKISMGEMIISDEECMYVAVFKK
jgi:coenzyme F420-0:L-glutamate ligase/coenzyme F420-1:gamma-L-glutamate ligase